MPIPKVIIVDDHPLCSKALISLIISQPLYMVVGEAKNLADTLELARTKNQDLAIVDLNLGDEDGRKLTDRQFQIFFLIGKGLGTLEIAHKLAISSKTVDARTYKDQAPL
jgi:DNA-binding NarL/FixJ family response regulator